MDDGRRKLGAPIEEQWAHRGKKVSFFGADSEEMDSNLNTGIELEYRFNDYGFRMDLNMDEIEPGGYLYMGDSHAVGVGCNLEDSWPWLFHHEYLKSDKQFVNLGSVSSGLDTYHRLLRYWLPILKPSKIFMYKQQVSIAIEYVGHDGTINVVGPWTIKVRTGKGDRLLPHSFNTDLHDHVITSELDRECRNARNKDALDWICQQHGVELHYGTQPWPVWEGRMNRELYGEARDGLHAGPRQARKHVENFVSQINL